MSTTTLSAQPDKLEQVTKPEIRLDYKVLTKDHVVDMAQLHAISYQDSGSSAASQLKLFWQGAYGKILDQASLGAWHNDRLVGVIIVLEKAPDEWCAPGESCEYPYIADLFVDPEYRRRGVASGLVVKASQAVAKLGRESLTLQLDITAAPEAMQLYEYLGFTSPE